MAGKGVAEFEPVKDLAVTAGRHIRSSTPSSAALHVCGVRSDRRRIRHRQAIPPVGPQVLADVAFLQAEGKELLCDDMRGRGRRDDRLHPAASP